MKNLFVKLLLGVFAVVVLAALGLFAASRRAEAGTIRATVAIARPAAAVFPWLVEDARLKQWVSWLEEVRPERSGGPPAAGHRAVWIMRGPNSQKSMSIAGEITAVDAPRSMDVKMEAPGSFSGTARYTLEEKDGATLLTYQSRFEYDSAIFKLLEPLVTPQARKKMNGDLQQLKRAVESAPLAAR